jgi:signal transduction histidine kinase/CRP-like cAMP-binding protein
MNSKRGTKAKPRTPSKGKTVRRRAPRRTPSASSHILDVLKRNIMFREVEPSVLRQCSSLFAQRHFDAGDLIFDEYSKGRDLFLIASGRVRIKKYTKFGVESLLAVLHPGDFFGEMSLIDGLPRSARAEAVDDSDVLILSADNYRDLIHRHHQIAFNLLNNLALRLRSMDQNFVMELGRNILASRSRMDRLNMLVEASKIVNSALDLGAVLALILDVATRSVGADRGTVYLVDQKSDELWSLVTSGAGMKEIRLPLGKGLAGYVARTGETVNIVDAYSDPRFNPEIDHRSGYTTHTVLCMPLRNRESQIVGVFQLLNKRTGYFGPEDESFLDALSIHAAIAIENARIAQEMVNNERLSAIGRMAATVLHDIRNPISTMRVYAGIIKSRSDSADAARMADEMIHQVDRLSAMIQEILEFSTGTSSTLLALSSLPSALELVLPSLETELMSRKIILVRQYGYESEALIDAGKFSRVITNLVENAADAMPDGGIITIRTSLSEAGITIDVVDTGTGIAEEALPRLFEPFFTQGKKHGTGLGLTIVKRIMEDHRGRVEVISTPGQGSTFRLVLPIPAAARR